MRRTETFKIRLVLCFGTDLVPSQICARLAAGFMAVLTVVEACCFMVVVNMREIFFLLLLKIRRAHF